MKCYKGEEHATRVMNDVSRRLKGASLCKYTVCYIALECQSGRTDKHKTQKEEEEEEL